MSIAVDVARSEIASIPQRFVTVVSEGCRGGLVHPTAVLGDGVILGKGAQVGPYVVLEDGVILGDQARVEAGSFIGEGSRIGARSWIGPHVTLREYTTVGKRTRIESGVVIGSDGFGFVTAPEGAQYKVPQLGFVEIGDDVAIGAGATIDRATMGKTTVGDRCRIGSFAMIGHNVTLYQDVVVGSGAGIGGSAVIEAGVQIGVRCGVIGHATVGAGAKIYDFTGVSKNVAAGQVLVGHPNMSPEEYAAYQQRLADLPGLLQRVTALEKNITQKA